MSSGPHPPATAPLLWPHIVSLRLLPQARDRASAHILRHYPYGYQSRCLKRFWCEQAHKGAQVHNWRLMTQTTHSGWNTYYDQMLEQQAKGECDQLTVDGWITNELATRLIDPDVVLNSTPRRQVTGRLRYWNTPALSTYATFVCLEEVICWPEVPEPGKTTDPSRAIRTARPIELSCHQPRQTLVDFLERIRHEGNLHLFNPDQLESLHRIEKIGRQYNPTAWPEPVVWEAYGFVS